MKPIDPKRELEMRSDSHSFSVAGLSLDHELMSAIIDRLQSNQLAKVARSFYCRRKTIEEISAEERIAPEDIERLLKRFRYILLKSVVRFKETKEDFRIKETHSTTANAIALPAQLYPSLHS